MSKLILFLFFVLNFYSNGLAELGLIPPPPWEEEKNNGIKEMVECAKRVSAFENSILYKLTELLREKTILNYFIDTHLGRNDSYREDLKLIAQDRSEQFYLSLKYCLETCSSSSSNETKISLVDRSKITRILAEHKFNLTGAVDYSNLPEIGKLLGVGYIISQNCSIRSSPPEKLNNSSFVPDENWDRRVLMCNQKLIAIETGEILATAEQEICKLSK